MNLFFLLEAQGVALASLFRTYSINCDKIEIFYNTLEKFLHIFKYLIGMLCLVLISFNGFGQRADTISVGVNNSNSLSFVTGDTLSTKDTLKVKTKKDIETTIKYNAVDSIRLDVLRQMVFLYGKASINYGDITLTAENIEINWSTNLVVARGDTDSTGKAFGLPIFKQGAEMYTSDVIKYNFKTKKGLISQVVTQQGEGYIHGETVKRKDDQLFVHHAMYTTCNLKHPHFYINASKLKLIPDDKIVAGPFNLVISDIPTPLGFLLGIFPVPKKNKSGLIFPTYGEDRLRGFFLSRGGWYFAISDHINAQLTGDIYSNKTYGLYGDVGYRKRYKYGGNAGFRLFSQNIEQPDGEMVRSSQYGIIWNHTTETKGTGSLSANVNVSSPDYYKVNSFNPNSRWANAFTSGVNYRKAFTGTPFNLTVAARHSMNVNTKIQEVTLPDVALTMTRLYPLKGRNSLGQKWYEKIYVSYDFYTKFMIDNNYNKFFKNTQVPSSFGLPINENTIQALLIGGRYNYNVDSLTKDVSLRPFSPGNSDTTVSLTGALYGARHRIPIGTSFKIFKNFSLNPTLVWNEHWYPKAIKYSEDKSGKLIEEEDRGFKRAYSFSGTGISLTTNIYGQLNFKNSKLMAIRHTVTPNLNYSYNPDFTDPRFRSYQQLTNVNGYERFVNYEKNERLRAPRFKTFDRLGYGYPVGRESSIMGFSVTNVFQGKVRTPKDTVNSTKKISLLDNLTFGSSYNLLADSFQLQNLRISANTNLFERFNFNFSTEFDPYYYQELGTIEGLNKRKE
ncbi:MAG TPA: putative LPS assembly protein LptD, partial [Cytophagaceae bacterium]